MFGGPALEHHQREQRVRVILAALGVFVHQLRDDIGIEEIRVPAVLERLAASAIRVSVTEGASVDAVLRRLELSQVMR